MPHAHSETLHERGSEHVIASSRALLTWVVSWCQSPEATGPPHLRPGTRLRTGHTRLTRQGCPAVSPALPELATPRHAAMGAQLSPPGARGSRPCLAHGRWHPCFGRRSDGSGEVLHSPHKRENLGTSLPEQFICSSSLREVQLGRKWQDESFGLHYSEEMCGLWISHSHNSIYIYHCWFSV